MSASGFLTPLGFRSMIYVTERFSDTVNDSIYFVSSDTLTSNHQTYLLPLKTEVELQYPFKKTLYIYIYIYIYCCNSQTRKCPKLDNNIFVPIVYKRWCKNILKNSFD